MFRFESRNIISQASRKVSRAEAYAQTYAKVSSNPLLRAAEWYGATLAAKHFSTNPSLDSWSVPFTQQLHLPDVSGNILLPAAVIAGGVALHALTDLATKPQQWYVDSQNKPILPIGEDIDKGRRREMLSHGLIWGTELVTLAGMAFGAGSLQWSLPTAIAGMAAYGIYIGSGLRSYKDYLQGNANEFTTALFDSKFSK